MNLKEHVFAPIIDDNPLTVQILGLCSVLAVSRTIETALIMSAAVISVLIFSNLAVSALRTVMPRSIRLIIEVTLVASAVIIVDEVLKVYAPAASQTLTIFVGLIITNCIVLGRAESFALYNPVHRSLADALGNGFGYGMILLLVASVRELLGSGSLMNNAILPADFPLNRLMSISPSAFFILGLIVWGLRVWRPPPVHAKSHAGKAPS